jgi:hypothetical protein
MFFANEDLNVPEQVKIVQGKDYLEKNETFLSEDKDNCCCLMYHVHLEHFSNTKFMNAGHKHEA